MANTRSLATAKSARREFTPEAYGVVAADGTTDDSAAIQAAIDACDANRGGVVRLRAERYAIATGLVVNNQGTVIEGQGMPGAAGANGSSRIVVANGITGITFNAASSGSSHRTLGYGLRNLQVVAASAATTGSGVVVNNAENLICENVNVSGFIGGTGLLIDGKASNAQYAQLMNFCAGDNLKSLHAKGTAPNGIRMFGGYLGGAGVTPRVGSIGIHIETGDTLRMFGTVIQGYEIGVYIESPALGHELHGPRFEYCNICLRLGATVDKFNLFGGTFVNSLLVNTGAGNIGIQVDSGAKRVHLRPTNIAGCANDIVDNNGAALNNYTNAITGDVTMTTNGTFYDGPSLTLGPGKWLLMGVITLLASTSAIRTFGAKLWDGTTTVAFAQHVVPGTATTGLVALPVSAVVEIASSQTYKISATSTVNADTIKGTTSKSCYLDAVKLD